MPITMNSMLLGTLLALSLGGAARAQTAAPVTPVTPIGPAVAAEPAVAAKGPPAGFTVPAEPKADESAALRNKSQPGNNAPIWRAVRDSGTQPGISNLPGAEQGVLIQPFVQYPGSRVTSAGEAWRQVRNQWIVPYGGALLLITLIAVGLFYKARGPLGGEETTGRKVERFTPFERAAHWANAGAFVVLAVSGIVMAFGKFFLLPIIGGTLFGWLTYALKTAHNFAGPVFAVSLLIVFFTFVRDNVPAKGDLNWLLKGGGMLRRGGHELPSHRFNAGEKLIFWVGILALGFTVIGSGLVLDKLIPGMAYLRTDMQVAHMIHAVGALLMMVMFIGHIYLGTIGTRGALQGMRTGWCDEAWAREHHQLWYDDIKAGKIPVQRSQVAEPAIGVATPQA